MTAGNDRCPLSSQAAVAIDIRVEVAIQLRAARQSGGGDSDSRLEEQANVQVLPH